MAKICQSTTSVTLIKWCQSWHSHNHSCMQYNRSNSTMCRLTLLLVVVGSLSACSGEEGIRSYVTWSSDPEYLLRQPKETWVKLYRKLENALLNSPELLDNLREKFFPSRSRYRAKDPASIDGIQVEFLPICVTFSPGLDHVNGNISLNGSITRCMNFRWTNSRLLNIIPVDQLSALDPFWTKMLYSAIVSSRTNGEHIVITLELDADDINYTTLNEEDIVISMAILLSWVSIIRNRLDIAGNSCWCKISWSCHPGLQKKFSWLKISRQRFGETTPTIS